MTARFESKRDLHSNSPAVEAPNAGLLGRSPIVQPPSGLAPSFMGADLVCAVSRMGKCARGYGVNRLSGSSSLCGKPIPHGSDSKGRSPDHIQKPSACQDLGGFCLEAFGGGPGGRVDN